MVTDYSEIGQRARSLRPRFGRRRLDTIPITTRRELERTPEPPPRPEPTPIPAPRPPRTPTPAERYGQLTQPFERQAYSETMAALAQQRADWDAERILRQQAMQAGRTAREAESERAGDYHKAQLNALGEAFAPNRADSVTIQALAFNPRYHDLPASELWEMARREEGRRNADEFGRAMSKMTPQEREVVGPLAAALIKNDLSAEAFREILEETRREGKGVYAYDVKDRRKVNRVIDALYDTSAPVFEQRGITARRPVPEEAEAPEQRRPPPGISAVPPRATPQPPETESPLGQWGRALAAPLIPFEEEYKAISPYTRPIGELAGRGAGAIPVVGPLLALAPEDIREKVGGEIAAQALLPSNIPPIGVAGKVAGAFKALKRAEQVLDTTADVAKAARTVRTIKAAPEVETGLGRVVRGAPTKLEAVAEELPAEGPLGKALELPFPERPVEPGAAAEAAPSARPPVQAPPEVRPIGAGDAGLAAPPGRPLADEKRLNDIRIWRLNAPLEAQFIDEQVVPAFLAKFHDAPVSIRVRRAGGFTGEPLIAISSAGWRERAESLGLVWIERDAADDLYAMSPLSAELAIAERAKLLGRAPLAGRGVVEPGAVVPVAQAAEDPNITTVRGAINDIDEALAESGTLPKDRTRLRGMRTRLVNRLKELGAKLGEEEGALRIGPNEMADIEAHVQVGLQRGVRITSEAPFGSSFMLPDGRFVGSPGVPHVELVDKLGYGRSTDVIERLDAALDAGLVRVAGLVRAPRGSRLVPGNVGGVSDIAGYALHAADRDGIQLTAAVLAKSNPEVTVFFEIGTSKTAKSIGGARWGRDTASNLAHGGGRFERLLGGEEGTLRLPFGRKPKPPEPALEPILKDIPERPKTTIVKGRRVAAAAEDVATDTDYTVQTSGVVDDAPVPTHAPSPKPVPKVEELTSRGLTHMAATVRRATISRGNSLARTYANDLGYVWGKEVGVRFYGGSKVDDLMQAGGDLAKFGLRSKKPGLSTNFHDVVEYVAAHPRWQQAYDMPEGMAKAIAYQIDLVRERLVRPLVDEGMMPAEWLSNAYHPRHVLSVRGNTVRIGPKQGVGAHQTFEFPRSHATVAEGKAKGVEYLESPFAEFSIAFQEVAHKIADHRLAVELGLEPETFIRQLDDVGGDIEKLLKQQSFKEMIEKRGALGIRTLKTPGEYTTAVNKARNTVNSIQDRLKTARANLLVRKAEVMRLTNRKATAGQVSSAQAKVDALDGRITSLVAELEDAKTVRNEAKSASARARRATAKPLPGEAYIREPVFGGKVAKMPTVEDWEKEFGEPAGPFVTLALRPLSEITKTLKPIWSGLDWSTMFLQDVSALGNNPRGTITAQARAFAGSVADPLLRQKHIHDNLAVYERMIGHGIPVGAVEFTADPSNYPLGIAGKYIYGRGPLKMSADLWNAGVDASAVNLWKFHTGIVDELGEDAAKQFMREGFSDLLTGSGKWANMSAEEQMAEGIAHFMGRETAKEGASHSQMTRLLLSSLPFAGTYWAGWLRGMASLHRAGVRGDMARKMFAGWVTGGVGLYAALAYATGQEPNLNPYDWKNFLTLELFDTKFGIGGPVRNVLVYAGKVAEDVYKNGGKDIDNISAKFVSGVASPGLSMAAELIKGETYIGTPVDPTDIKSLLTYAAGHSGPFILQEVVQAAVEGAMYQLPVGETKESVISGAKSAIGTGFGLRAFPESPFEVRNEIAEQISKGKYKYGELTPNLQKQVRDALPDLTRHQIERRRQMEAASGDLRAKVYLEAERATEEANTELSRLAEQIEAGEPGGPTKATFRDLRKEQDTEARGRGEFIDRLLGIDPDERPTGDPRDDPILRERQDLWDYRDIFNTFEAKMREPGANVPDLKDEMFNAIDAFKDELGPDREAALDNNIGVGRLDIPLEQEFREVRRALRTSGFFRRSEDAWTDLVGAYQGQFDWTEVLGQPDLPATEDDFRQGLVAYLMRQGYDNMEARVLAERNQILRAADRRKQILLNQWRQEYRELIEPAVEWGYKVPGAIDLRFRQLE